MSEPLDTTPCRRPSASSTNGTLASLRGRAGGITRAVLDFSQSANGASPSPRRTAAPQWRDAAEHTRDHRQDDDADVELTIDPSSHAGPGSRPARLCGVTRDRVSGAEHGWRELDVGQLHTRGGDAVLGIAEPHGVPAWRNLDGPPGGIPVCVPLLAGGQSDATSCTTASAITGINPVNQRKPRRMNL